MDFFHLKNVVDLPADLQFDFFQLFLCKILLLLFFEKFLQLIDLLPCVSLDFGYKSLAKVLYRFDKILML